MYFQAVRFSRTDDSEQVEIGIAKLTAFDTYDAEFIIDAEGKKVDEVWSYQLIMKPLSYIDTSY